MGPDYLQGFFSFPYYTIAALSQTITDCSSLLRLFLMAWVSIRRGRGSHIATRLDNVGLTNIGCGVVIPSEMRSPMFPLGFRGNVLPF